MANPDRKSLTRNADTLGKDTLFGSFFIQGLAAAWMAENLSLWKWKRLKVCNGGPIQIADRTVVSYLPNQWPICFSLSCYTGGGVPVTEGQPPLRGASKSRTQWKRLSTHAHMKGWWRSEIFLLAQKETPSRWQKHLFTVRNFFFFFLVRNFLWNIVIMFHWEKVEWALFWIC